MAKCPHSWITWYGTYHCSSPCNPTNLDGKKGKVVGSPNGREHIEAFCLDGEFAHLCQYHPVYHEEIESTEEVAVTSEDANTEKVEREVAKEVYEESTIENYEDVVTEKNSEDKVTEEKEPKYFCRYCGKSIPTDSRFCSFCGEKL